MNIACVTAQHREMLHQVFSLFQLKAGYDLDYMKSGQDLTDITCAVLAALKPVLQDFQPRRVILRGDTTTALASSLAAYYAQKLVSHRKAGFRTNNL